jgi:aspartate aminotransferase
VYSLEEMKMVARLAVKHKFFVVSDEIYEKLIYGATKHISIASLGKEISDLTVTVNGVSKSYSMTGWRIGYTAGPIEVMRAIGNLQSHAASNPASVSQRAALAALEGSQDCVEEMKREFAKRCDIMISGVESIRNMSCVKPEGAFYLFCDISKLKMSSVEVANRLLDEARVATIPGEPFGADDFIRLSFATAEDKIKKALSRIKEWVQKNG